MIYMIRDTYYVQCIFMCTLNLYVYKNFKLKIKFPISLRDIMYNGTQATIVYCNIDYTLQIVFR